MRRAMGSEEPIDRTRDPQQWAMQQEIRERIDQQFRDAEVMAGEIASLEAQVREEAAAAGRPTEGVAGRSQMGEDAAGRLRQELVEALRSEPIEWSRVRQLQGMIKLVEPESYSSEGAIRDVVHHQQVLASSLEPVSPESSEGEAGADRGGQATNWVTGDEMIQGPRITDPQLLTQSARSSLAQLMRHVGGNTMSQLKAVAKYCYRIDMAREGTGANPDTPEIRSNFTHERLFHDQLPNDALQNMVMDWARSHGGADQDFDILAHAYIQFRLAWARDAVQGLQVLTTSRQAAMGEESPRGLVE